MRNKISFIVPYPLDEAPSQRFRFEQYFDVLKENGFQIVTQSFIDKETWAVLYEPGYSFKKSFGILKGFLRRVKLMFNLKDSEYVFLHREASPIGPPIFEFIIAKVLKKKIIYDFDDAIWIKNTSGNNKIIAWLKWHGKVKQICRWAYRVSCGNSFLANFAIQFNSNVKIIPSTIDTEGLHNGTIENRTGKLTIGWTGTHTTLKYLDKLFPVLDQLNETNEFNFVVISNQKPMQNRTYLRCITWSKVKEINDLLLFDIGVMPLENDKWSEGKCGFKALQYMALGIPTILSPVGVNTQIVHHNVNGILAETEEEWVKAIEVLVFNESKRIELSKNALATIQIRFSKKANQSNFLALFE